MLNICLVDNKCNKMIILEMRVRVCYLYFKCNIVRILFRRVSIENDMKRDRGIQTSQWSAKM